MITIDEMEEYLEQVAEELPQKFYEELNGGILLLPEAKLSPEARADDLYTLGEYNHTYTMGRYIVIYYGSFVRLFPDQTDDYVRKEVRETLLHEFTHHLESLSGLRDLEVEDDQELAQYLRGTLGYSSPPLKHSLFPFSVLRSSTRD